MSDLDLRLEATILELLDGRGPGKTICPSEAARAVASESSDETGQWRHLVAPSRRAAARLAKAGVIDVTQGGDVVDPVKARGPVRLRRRVESRGHEARPRCASDETG